MNKYSSLVEYGIDVYRGGSRRSHYASGPGLEGNHSSHRQLQDHPPLERITYPGQVQLELTVDRPCLNDAIKWSRLVVRSLLRISWSSP